MLGRPEGNHEEAAAPTSSIPRRLTKWKIETAVSPAIFAILGKLARRSFNDRTVASDGGSQIASLTPVSADL